MGGWLYSLLCVSLVFLSCLNVTGAEYSTCDNYPDADIIVLLEESIREVLYTTVLTFASLPEEWHLEWEVEVSYENVLEDIEEQGYPSKTIYAESKFDYRYVQYFETDDESWVLIEIDNFMSSDTPRHVLEAHRRVISQARNVGDLRATGTKYGEEGIICSVGSDYHLYFTQGSRFFMIYGNSSDNVRLFAELYTNQENPMIVKEKYHWMARVCESGTDECTKEIYYNSRSEDVILGGCEVTYEGSTTECPEDRIQKYSGYIKIPFHSCNKDDILNLEYEKTTLFPILNEFWSPRDFYFNSTKPTDKFSLKVITPTDIEITHKSPLGLLNQYLGSENRNVYLWERTRVPPYEREAYMPYTRKVVDKVTYTSVDSWSKIEDWFNDLFSNSIDTSAVEEKTQEITANVSDRDSKIKQLYEWVRDNVRYEYSELGFLSGYRPNPAEEVLNYRFGDCKDHTILLVSMLESAGIDAYPVLVARSTFEQDIPSPYEFYHSIVAVPKGDKFIWLDPTCSHCPYKYIHPNEQGHYAMILLDNKEGFMQIDELEVDKIRTIEQNLTINLRVDGTAVVGYTLRETGYSAILDADELDEGDIDSVKEVLEDYINAVCSEGELNSFNIMSSEKDVGIFTIQLTIQCKKFASTSGDKILFDLEQKPMFYGIVKEEKRVFPIAFDDSLKMESHTTILLPEGYSIESLPEDFSLYEDFAEYESKFSEKEKSIYSYTKAFIKEGEIPATKFSNFKKFFLDISSNSKKGIILYPATGEQATTTTTPTITEATTQLTTQLTTQPTTLSEEEPEITQTCSPALPAAIIIGLSLLVGIPYTLTKK